MASEVEEKTSTLDSVDSSVDSSIDPNFKHEIKDICGEDVMLCYQCGECTGGCPAAQDMGVAPNQVIRMAQLGMKDEVLSSPTIWMCAGCETCATRCPRGVSLARIMDACRQLAIKSGKKPPEPAVLAFHEEFLNEVQRNGRVHEISLTAFYKLRTKQFLADVFQGIQMFLKGKLALLPSRIKGRKEVKKLFKDLK